MAESFRARSGSPDRSCPRRRQTSPGRIGPVPAVEVSAVPRRTSQAYSRTTAHVSRQARRIKWTALCQGIKKAPPARRPAPPPTAGEITALSVGCRRGRGSRHRWHSAFMRGYMNNRPRPRTAPRTTVRRKAANRGESDRADRSPASCRTSHSNRTSRRPIRRFRFRLRAAAPAGSRDRRVQFAAEHPESPELRAVLLRLRQHAAIAATTTAS